VLKQGAVVSEADLLAHCREALAAYKIPRLVRFVTESALPLTTTGKVQKNRIAAQIFPECTGAQS
jgi:acyl-CoA synthetase (AMP-forming)/AMP-acid ligase II